MQQINRFIQITFRYTGLGGGVPIIVDGQCIGPVAVSGLSQQEDEALAEDFIKTIL